jgi:two-component system, OmpR family, phosphate regulon sensor histidine kinase PhoR
MRRRHFVRIIVVYILSLVITVAMLVWWIIAVLPYHWAVLTGGSILMGLLIVGLTFQLAHALGERNYARRQDEFVANVTHEMKSPLAAIKLHAQTLEQIAPADEQRSVQFILQQVGRMETLVDNVLESSRLVAKKKKRAALVPTPLAPFFSAYFDEVRRTVEGRGLAFDAHVDTHATVLASDEGLRRVMSNLVENAVRFSHKGGEIRCRVEDTSGAVRIEVEDDGIGIPRQELPKIFDRFYQIGKEITGRRGGTGLGLAIVAGLVKEMNGDVKAVAYDGKPGTRFVVTLPFAEGQS